jgi:NADH/NAD ratio-sensing transcriptional regulator Rex
LKIKTEHEKKITAIQVERNILAKEKEQAQNTADSLTKLVDLVPKVIYKNKTIYVQKIDSVLHLSSDKRVVYFTERTRKGFR